MLPCDVTDIVNLYPSVHHDKAFVIIIALLKEPRATASFVNKALALVPAYSVDDLAAVLLETLDDIRSPTEAHRKQIQALNQQGAGRFTGVASTCRAWGLIECVPAEGQEESEEKERRRHTRGCFPGSGGGYDKRASQARPGKVRNRRRPCPVAGPRKRRRKRNGGTWV